MKKLFNKINVAFGVYLVLLFFSGNQAIGQISFEEKEVRFQNGPVELSGTLMLPQDNKPVPAIVFLHGSGPHERTWFRTNAEMFARLGIASLFFDKRGSGSSGGSWTTSSLDDIAGDVLAAIQFLKTEDKINPNKIGFWGISQAGWVASLASSKSQDIAFMIINSGGGASPKQSEYYSIEKRLEDWNFTEDEKTEAFKLVDEYYHYLETGEGRDLLVNKFNELKSDPENTLQRLRKLIYIPSEENRKNWSWVATYDPINDVEKMNFPVLLLFGSLDRNHPTELSVDRWKQGLEKAGNENVTIMVFPGAGHGIRMGATHSMNAPFPDGYEEIQLGWLWLNALKP